MTITINVYMVKGHVRCCVTLGSEKIGPTAVLCLISDVDIVWYRVTVVNGEGRFLDSIICIVCLDICSARTSTFREAFTTICLELSTVIIGRLNIDSYSSTSTTTTRDLQAEDN